MKLKIVKFNERIQKRTSAGDQRGTMFFRNATTLDSRPAKVGRHRTCRTRGVEIKCAPHEDLVLAAMIRVTQVVARFILLCGRPLILRRARACARVPS